jgi:hypothetical protein
VTQLTFCFLFDKDFSEKPMRKVRQKHPQRTPQPDFKKKAYYR